MNITCVALAFGRRDIEQSTLVRRALKAPLAPGRVMQLTKPLSFTLVLFFLVYLTISMCCVKKDTIVVF